MSTPEREGQRVVNSSAKVKGHMIPLTCDQMEQTVRMDKNIFEYLFGNHFDNIRTQLKEIYEIGLVVFRYFPAYV